MEAVISTVTPLLVTAAVAGGVVYYTGGQLCGAQKGKDAKKSTKTANAPVNKDEQVTEEDIDTFFPEKKKTKPTKAPVKLTMPKTSTLLGLNKPAPKAAQPKKAAEEPKKEETGKKKTAAVEPKKAEEQKKKEEPKKKEEAKPLSEVEQLRLRILELEKAANAAKAPKEDPKKKEKNATAEDYNPQPVMTQQQKEEQQKLLETYERGNAWVEVKEQKRSKPKSKKDIELLDLNSYTTVDSMTVTQADRFTILGEKGARLQQIIQLCGNDVKIELSHRPAKPLANASEEPMTIDIQGTEQQIKLAKKIITELTAKGYSTDLTPDTIEWLCRIAASDVPKIMGPKAQYVKTIQDKTGVKIVVPPKDEEDKSAKKSAKGGDDEKKITVRVIGQEQQVNEAKEAVRLLVQFGYSPLTHENFEQITVDFPTEYRKYLLMSFNSSDAALIHKIQQLTNCKLILPQKEVRPIVHIVGPAKDVYTAASQLKQIIDKLKQPVVDVFLPGFEGTDFSKNELW